MCLLDAKFPLFELIVLARRQPCCELLHPKIENFSIKQIAEFIKSKFSARKGKSAANTYCICEHFNALLWKICLYKPYRFEFLMPTGKLEIYLSKCDQFRNETDAESTPFKGEAWRYEVTLS